MSTKDEAKSIQQVKLRKEWPMTCAQLESTYFTAPHWAITHCGTQNSAGYILWALQRYESAACALLPGTRFTRAELDLAAGREVSYQWTKGRQFRSIPAALAQCWYNLVAERPLRLDEARKILARRDGPPQGDTRLFSVERSTVTPALSTGWTPRTTTPSPTA